MTLDQGTARHLVEEHRELVPRIARAYAGQGLPLEVLVRAGTVGLLKAVCRYDPSRGVRFASLAKPWVHGTIRAVLCARRD